MNNKISNFSPKNESVRYLVKSILLSELPDWDADQQAFIEGELERLTAGGEEVVSVIRDHEDLWVVLKAPAGGVA